MPLLRTGFISLKFRYYDDRAFHVNERCTQKEASSVSHFILRVVILGQFKRASPCGTVFLRSDRVREVKQSVDDLTKPSFSS